MLSVTLICVGKLKEKFYKEACAEYEKRLKLYCKLEIIELNEERLPENPSQALIDAALSKEAAEIRAKIPQGAALIPLCIEGKTLSSEGLADAVGKLTTGGISRLCFVIGGSCGLSGEIKQAAALRLSMSPMTFPHHLARVMVLEQIYRSLNILSGGKYHK